jgi:hypothetical protein
MRIVVMNHVTLDGDMQAPVSSTGVLIATYHAGPSARATPETRDRW